MTLLGLAEAGVFEPLWSEQILTEVERALQAKLGLTEAKARSRISHMRSGFEAALVDDVDDLVPQMTCHPRDRHVLAAAVRAEARTLVTINLKDFPVESTTRYGVVVQHPDRFLSRLLVEQHAQVLAALASQVALLRKPPTTMREWLATLTRLVPNFANLAADLMDDQGQDLAPIPALVTVDERDALAAFGKREDFTNPAQVGLLWWAGMANNLDQARALTYDQRVWGDYRWAKDLINGRALASRVMRAVDAPNLVAFMRFIPEPPSPVQVLQAFATTAVFLVLVRVSDGTWRVWGLRSDMPAARDVIGEAGIA